MSHFLLRRAAGIQFRRAIHPRFSSSTPTIPIPPRSWAFRTSLLVAGFSLTSYTLGSFFPPETVTLISPRAAPAPPDANTPESKAYMASLESQLQSLPLLKEHRSRPDADEWYEVRPYQNFPEERRVNNLTAGALRGPGKLGAIPIVRARKDESESIIFGHLGRGLCGHDGIVHGGVLAALMDEGLGRTAINNLPEKVGVTANLSITYRAPTKADQYFAIKTKLIDVQGRKAWVEGRVEDMNGTLLAEAKVMFVQPKYAKLLNTNLLQQAMGEPPKSSEPIHLGKGSDKPIVSGKV